MSRRVSSACGFVAAGLALLVTAPTGRSQTADARPRFEVVSVKPNNGCHHHSDTVVQERPHPGRLQYGCMSLRAMIQYAYGTYADGATHSSDVLRMVGLPDWGMDESEERFVVEGKAPQGTGFAMMAGPMFQTVLEDRFQLKFHRETQEVPGFALVVGKKGWSLTPAKEGSCAVFDGHHPPQLAEGQHFCGDYSGGWVSEGVSRTKFYGVTLSELCRSFLPRAVERPVIDQTGIEGRYNFQLEFAREDSGSLAAPGIFGALEQQLGLKLVSRKVPAEHFVIDHVERPSAN